MDETRWNISDLHLNHDQATQSFAGFSSNATSLNFRHPMKDYAGYPINISQYYNIPVYLYSAEDKEKSKWHKKIQIHMNLCFMEYIRKMFHLLPAEHSQ